MKTPTYEEIKPYLEKKLVSERSHPEDANVRIFNYTQECQFSGAWDDVTRQCRGLILNVATGEIIARPFPKFFNYQEHVQKEMPIPAEAPTVYPKFDGSLGILYYLNDKPYIATRGSFVSEQALWANEFLNTPSVQGWLQDLDRAYTHLFEIIYPENRIVVNYDFSDLVHLASVHKETSESIEPDSFFPLASRIPFTSYEEIQKLDEPNSEGFVLFYPKENIRMKVKFPEYVRLHKLVTGLSEIAIWEHMRDGKSLDELIENVPDEFFEWVTKVQNQLQASFDAIEAKAKSEMEEVRAELYGLIAGGAIERKDWAIAIQKKQNPGILFAILDGKDYAPAIWKMVRPHGQSAYKVDIDS